MHPPGVGPTFHCAFRRDLCGPSLANDGLCDLWRMALLSLVVIPTLAGSMRVISVAIRDALCKGGCFQCWAPLPCGDAVAVGSLVPAPRVDCGDTGGWCVLRYPVVSLRGWSLW